MTKKLFSFILVTLSLIYSCNNEQTNNTKEEIPNVYISATSSTVDASGEFTIYCDITPTTPITVGVTSQNSQILTITDSYVTIPKGTKEIKGKFKGISEGKTAIYITSKDANIGTGSVEVAIGKALPKLSITAEKIDVDETNEFTVSSDIPAEEPITVSITSSDNTIISITTPTLIIPKGEKVIKGMFKGLKKGVANLVIAANNVNIIKDIHEVTVGDVPQNSGVLLTVSTSSSDDWGETNNSFTIHSNKIATSKITITVTSSNENVLKIIDKSVVIQRGHGYAQGYYLPVGGGKAKIIISTATEGVTINVKEVDITVEFPFLISCDKDNIFSNEWFANGTSYGFTLWFKDIDSKYNHVCLENLGADYYGQNLTLKSVEYGTDISTLFLNENLGHTLVGTNKNLPGYGGSEILPTFTEAGTYYIVFNVADNVDYFTDLSELTHDNVEQKNAWALVTVTMTGDKASKVVLHSFKCPATIVGK